MARYAARCWRRSSPFRSPHPGRDQHHPHPEEGAQRPSRRIAANTEQAPSSFETRSCGSLLRMRAKQTPDEVGVCRPCTHEHSAASDGPVKRRPKWHGRAGHAAQGDRRQGCAHPDRGSALHEDIADICCAAPSACCATRRRRSKRRHGAGALEIPGAIVMSLDGAADREQPYDGVVALGCVIRGGDEPL